MAMAPISDDLYAALPAAPLYHYTSLHALKGIVRDRSLWATDIYYLNDAAELRYLAQLLQGDIARRVEDGTQKERLYKQFHQWLSIRLSGHGHRVFVVCFTERGNLLSQWRGYTPAGKGLSLGFAGSDVALIAARQNFRLGKCIYDLARQHSLAAQILDNIASIADLRGEDGRRHSSESFHNVFEDVEDELLQIASLIKHPSFHEEEEWRAVSPVHSNYVTAPILYRDGASLLIPYIEFSLKDDAGQVIRFENVILGPTQNADRSMNSLSRYLMKERPQTNLRVTNSGIPYRTW